ncbi:MAG: transglutaminase-like domain-containing protein [Chitinophagaceae bacterium]|nr:transglutaminase-like domain-containing protein [Chitinophagaceae bacterium]
MQATKEIDALLTLIDDPDEEVYFTVSEKLIAYGKAIIPNLEHLWETTLNDSIQERIEMIIHRLHYSDLSADFVDWRDGAYNDLLLGALLVDKFQYPDLQSIPVIQEIEKLRRNIWLELNNFLTPLEQANVLSSILYKYFRLKGVEINHNCPEDFCIHKVLSAKKGNAITNGIIYQVMCELLDVNARIVNIPKQCIIAFFQSDYDPAIHIGDPQEFIQFYIDTTTGQAFSHKDIENYFVRIGQPAKPVYFKPLTHKQIIQLLIRETSKCFNNPNNNYKQEELKLLADLLD